MFCTQLCDQESAVSWLGVLRSQAHNSLVKKHSNGRVLTCHSSLLLPVRRCIPDGWRTAQIYHHI